MALLRGSRRPSTINWHSSLSSSFRKSSSASTKDVSQSQHFKSEYTSLTNCLLQKCNLMREHLPERLSKYSEPWEKWNRQSIWIPFYHIRSRIWVTFYCKTTRKVRPLGRAPSARTPWCRESTTNCMKRQWNRRPPRTVEMMTYLKVHTRKMAIKRLSSQR